MKKLIAFLPLLSVVSPLAATFNHPKNNITIKNQQTEQTTFYVWAQHAMVEKNIKTIVGNDKPANWNTNNYSLTNIKLDIKNNSVIMTIKNRGFKKSATYTAIYAGINYDIKQWKLVTVADINVWKTAVKTITIQKVFNRFTELSSQYHWDAKKTKIASLHFSVNDNGTFFGAYLELQNSIDATANFYIKYNKKLYDINDWKVQSLPNGNNGQLIWSRAFFSWIHSQGKDDFKQDVLSQMLITYWNDTSQMHRNRFAPDWNKWTDSYNYQLMMDLRGRFNFLNFLGKTYTAFNSASIKVTPNTITGRINILENWDDQYHLFYVAHYTPGVAFNYKQIKPDLSINKTWFYNFGN